MRCLFLALTLSRKHAGNRGIHQTSASDSQIFSRGVHLAVQVFVGTQHVSSSPSPNRDAIDLLPPPSAFVHLPFPHASLPIFSPMPPSDREGFIPIPPSTAVIDDLAFSPSPRRESGDGEGEEEMEREEEREREEGRRAGRRAGSIGRLPFDRELPGGVAVGGGLGGVVGGGIGGGVTGEAWRGASP